MWVFSMIFWQWIEVILRLLQLTGENRLESGAGGCKELRLDAQKEKEVDKFEAQIGKTSYSTELP